MTSQEINDLAFFTAMLDDYKSGALLKDQAVGALFAFSAALRGGDLAAASTWAMQGRKLACKFFLPDRTLVMDESRKLFAGDGVSKWLHEEREERAQQDDRGKSERWWAQLAEPERLRWQATSSGGTVLGAWLAWRDAAPSPH